MKLYDDKGLLVKVNVEIKYKIDWGSVHKDLGTE